MTYEDQFYAALNEIANKNAQEAYQILSELVEKMKVTKSTMLADVIYTRATLDISQIREHHQQSIDDFTYLIDQKTKYIQESHGFLALLYDSISEIDQVILHGKEALKKECTFENDIKFALARAYARKEDEASFQESLYYIQDCIDHLNEFDDEMQLRICKIDVLISLERLEEAEQEIGQFRIDFPQTGMTYYLKARLAMQAYKKDMSKTDYLDDVISNATIYLQYEENDDLTRLMMVEAYTFKKDYQQALVLLDEMENDENQEYILLEKTKVYEALESYSEGISLMNQYLSGHESWKISYIQGVFYKLRNEEGDLLLAKESFLKAYRLSEIASILTDVIDVNHELGLDEDTYQFLCSELAKTKDGRLYYILADTAFKLEKSYDEILGYYQKAFEYGYLNELEYLDILSDYSILNRQQKQKIKKYSKQNIASLPRWGKRKMAVRFMYGENGIKQNLKKAQNLLEIEAENNQSSCVLALIGRNFELMKNDKEAFSFYQNAYQEIAEEAHPHCDCAYGYLAHAYLEGKGVTKDIEKAKQIILSAVEKVGTGCCSHTAYYYAYFYLNGDQRFTAKMAMALLESNYPFYRYDVSRVVLLKQVAKKSNYNSHRLTEIENEIIAALDKKERQYYDVQKDQISSLPYWKNV
ncbi:MAG: hypothetical protein NC182_02580 [Prevotella sp.]|nr:hypothetical protein [Staphylococcus sp.]MCM1350070.1 hypothetical protein [Prevotella sp.]